MRHYDPFTHTHTYRSHLTPTISRTRWERRLPAASSPLGRGGGPYSCHCWFVRGLCITCDKSAHSGARVHGERCEGVSAPRTPFCAPSNAQRGASLYSLRQPTQPTGIGRREERGRRGQRAALQVGGHSTAERKEERRRRRGKVGQARSR